MGKKAKERSKDYFKGYTREEIRISLKVTGQNVRLEDLVAAKEGRKHEVI